MQKVKHFYPHLLAFIGFVLVSIIYFYPVLQGKKILQSDIVQYTAMAKEQNDFREQTNSEPYWTNSAFGGMPTYQLGANYPHNYIKKIDGLIRFLPRPADYLFLYFLGFYLLLLVLKVNPLKAFFGALTFGFSTYLIIILGVGHNAKAHAIAYMPLVIAGVMLVYKQKKYIVGGLLTLVAAALEINANHPQMTFYLLLFLVVITIYFIYDSIKKKEIRQLLFCFLTFLIAGVFAVGSNATSLLATSQYAKESTRGKSDLTYNPDGSKSNNIGGMTYDYITEYSYGLAESFNLIAPRIFGGSNNENLGTNSAMYEYVVAQNVPEDQAKEIVKGLPIYWGDQPIVAAPAYIGSVVFFLAVFALFCSKRKIKYVFLAGTIFALILSWGKNFAIVTDFFIDFVPMYNKFRAVSSIQVIVEICMPVLAIIGLESFFRADDKEKWQCLLKSAGVSLGVLVLLLVFKGSFSFAGGSDSYLIESYGPEFVDALKVDRKELFTNDLIRSIILILATFTVLFFALKNRLSQQVAIVLVGLIMVGDLFFIDKNYLNAASFVSKNEVDNPFEETGYDTEILKDKSIFRVFEVSQGAMSDPRASYFHKSIGGYSAVKPRRMQELFDYQIAKNNFEVLNMLHVKYLIQTDDKGEKSIIRNTKTNGNAWFVKNIQIVKSADAEMKALSKFDSKNTALFDLNLKQNGIETNFVKDTKSQIALKSYMPNDLKYESSNLNNGYAVFSEIYYKEGWNAYIDGKLSDNERVNYLLRGLFIPAGKHKIEFKFEPQVVKTGSMISLVSFIGILLLLGGGIYCETRKK